MKFGKQLQLKSSSQWGDHYADYKHLKKEIKTGSEVGVRRAVTEEIQKVSEFFSECQADCLKLKVEMEEQIQAQKIDEEVPIYSPDCLAQFEKLHQDVESLKMFAELNEAAFFRIFKKMEKQCLWDVKGAISDLRGHLQQASFMNMEILNQLRMDINQAFFQVLPRTTPSSNRPELYLTPRCPTVIDLDLKSYPVGTTRVFICLAYDGLNQPLRVPVVVIKGSRVGPVLGITAAVHGNELNGIPLIHRLIRNLDPNCLSGTVVAVPVVNPPGYLRAQRGYSDNSDLNRLFPGKRCGTAAQQFCYSFMEKIVKKLDYLIDLHTASLGRANSLYVRADMMNPTTRKMAVLQNPQIIVHNTSPDGSLRGAAMACKIPAITVEIGDPQRIHKGYVGTALLGVENIMFSLKMIGGETESQEQEPTVCTHSYWIFSQEGGVLTVLPEVNMWVRQGVVIAEIHSIFGDLVAQFKAPEDGIVVGKSVNPMCNSGDRVIHLGVVTRSFPSVSADGHL